MKNKIQINKNKALIGDFVLEFDEAALAAATAINQSATTEEAVSVYCKLLPTASEPMARERVNGLLELVQQLKRGSIPLESEIFADLTKGKS